MKIELIPSLIRKRVKRLLQPLILLCVRLHLNPNGLTTITFFTRLISACQRVIGSLMELNNTLGYLCIKERITHPDLEYCN